MSETLSASSFRVNEPSVVYQAFTDEVVLINLESGNYYSVAKSGAEIWSLIAAGTTVPDLEERIASRYTGDPDAIRGALREFLRTLAQEKLIVPTDPSEVPPPPAADPASPRIADDRAPFDRLELQKYSDMQELLALDPVHDVDEFGWPGRPTSSGRLSKE